MDRKMALRSKLLRAGTKNDTGTGYIPGIGIAQYDEKVDAWLMDKAALAEKVRYDVTFSQLFDQQDHATRDKFMKLVLFFIFLFFINILLQHISLLLLFV